MLHFLSWSNQVSSGHGQTDIGMSSEVTYNMFEPVGVLVYSVGLPIDLMGL